MTAKNQCEYDIVDVKFNSKNMLLIHTQMHIKRNSNQEYFLHNAKVIKKK